MLTRHNLLKIDQEGRKFALKEALKQMPHADEKALYRLIMDKKIPPIVKRQEGFEEGYLEVGFSSCLIIDGNRFRAQSKIPIECVIGCITPYNILEDLVTCSEDKLKARLSTLAAIGERLNIKTGIYGSAALQMVTGYNYFNENSDIDVVIKTKELNNAANFKSALTAVKALKGLKIDVEVDISGGYFVKLTELLSEQKTILAKGLRGVTILNRLDALQVFVEEQE